MIWGFGQAITPSGWKQWSMSLLGIIWGLIAWGQTPELSPLTVTSPRLPVERRYLPQARRIITREEITKAQQTSVIEILRQEAGLNLVRTGSVQQNSSVFMRGSEAEHTLILIDGFDASDPSGPSGSFPFEFLSADNIERIEILKGPQSTLYGSKALGGVINIITRRGSGPAQTILQAEAGTQETYRLMQGLRGASGKFHYSYTLSHQQNAGHSQARDKGHDQWGQYRNPEKDSQVLESLTARFGYRLAEHLESEVLIRGIDSRFEADQQPGRGGDDPNRKEGYQALLIQANVSGSLGSQNLHYTFGMGEGQHTRFLENPPDSEHPEVSESADFSGKTRKIGGQIEWKSPWHRLIAGYEHYEESAQSEDTLNGEPGWLNFTHKEASRLGRYLENTLIYEDQRWKSLLSLGARLETDPRFGSETTRSAHYSLHYQPSQSGVRLSQATGFRTPTLFGLFSVVGNPALRPEKSLGREWSFEQAFDLEDLNLQGSFSQFENQIQEMIGFDPNLQKMKNVQEVHIQGTEIELSGRWAQRWQVRYTNTGLRALEAHERREGPPLLNRPDHQYTLALAYEAPDWRLGTDYLFVGERHDQNQYVPESPRVRLAPYRLVNLNGSYQWNLQVRLTLVVKNTLAEDYEELLGFGTPGRQILGGLQILL